MRYRSSGATGKSNKRIQELLDQVQVFNKDNVPAFKYRKQIQLKKKVKKIFSEKFYATRDKLPAVAAS